MDLMAEKLIDTLYMQIVKNIDEEVCLQCPLVRAVRDMKETLRDANSEQIITELGLTFRVTDCPCSRKFNRSG